MCNVEVEFWNLINSPKSVDDVLKFLLTGNWPTIEIEGKKVLTKELLREKVKGLDIKQYHSISATSGTTGTPVLVPKTLSSQIWFTAVNLYDLILNNWLFKDGEKVVCMTAKCISEEKKLETGCVIYSIPLLPVKEFEKVIEKIQPTHIYTYPSILNQIKLPSSVISVRSCGEIGATSYSSEETGIIALKPNGCDLYHIMPNIIVENGENCALITDLTNRLITRYVLGDIVVLTDRVCSCGRKTSSLEVVKGRIRGMLKLENGDKIWPTIGEPLLKTITSKIVQHQTIQTGFYNIIFRAKVTEPLSEEEKERLIVSIKHHLKIPNASIKVEEVDEFSPGKHECFICLV